jgi:signal transduction histidine kinase
VSEFWAALKQIPGQTVAMDAFARYDYVQQKILPRRTAVSEVVREFATLNQSALREGEEAFTRTRRTATNRLLVVLALSLLLAAAVAVFSVAHSRKLERQTQAQYEEVSRAKLDLQRLSGRLMEIQEEERTRLSRELHDEIGQTLATLRMELSRAESLTARNGHEIRERLARARDLAERTVRTVRNISLLLRPSLLDDLGLAPALQWQAEDFSRRSGIPCTFDESGLDESLPEALRTCVYRILQESLHNCEKHSRASIVHIRVRQTPTQLTLEALDDGLGFQENQDRPVGSTGLGLLGMRERAVALGGHLDIHSESGLGTRLVLTLPITATALSVACGSAT